MRAVEDSGCIAGVRANIRRCEVFVCSSFPYMCSLKTTQTKFRVQSDLLLQQKEKLYTERLSPPLTKAIQRRGPKSRAGLMAYPVLRPKEVPIATTRRPMMSGLRFACTGWLRASTIA